MAGKSAVLNIKIVSDASKAGAGFADAESRVARFERGLDRASVAAGAVLAGMAALGKAAVDSASALQQSQGAVESVFGSQSRLIQAVSEDAAGSVGLAESAYNDLAATLGASLKNMGVAMEDLAPTTSRLIQNGADLAATFGGSTEEAVSALGSALRGEMDPLERYGIGIKQADIDARLTAMGLDELTGAAAEQARTQALLAMITEQSGGALGAFARETDTAAGASAIASANWENAKATLGEVLLPVVTAVAEKVAEFSQWLMENKDVVLAVLPVIAGLAGGILALNGAMNAYKTVQTLVNGVINASPLMRLVAIISGIVGIVILMYNKFSWFRDLVSVLGDVFGSVFGFISDVIGGVVDVISWIVDKLSWIGDAASWVGDLFSAGVNVNVAGGTAGAMMGAAAGMRGAPMIAGAAGGVVGSSGGAGAGPGMVVNVTVNGAIDPVGTGRQIEKVLRDYGRATGRTLAVNMGAAR